MDGGSDIWEGGFYIDYLSIVKKMHRAYTGYQSCLKKTA